MKHSLFMFLLGVGLASPVVAQDTVTPDPVSSIPSAGPGTPLPAHSEAWFPDPAGVFDQARAFASDNTPRAEELLALLWLVSALHMAYQVQRGGFAELVEPLLRLGITWILLSTWTATLLPALLDSCHALQAFFPLDTGANATTVGVGSLVTGTGIVGGLATTVMTGGLSTAVFAIAALILAVTIVGTWTIQIIFKAFLMALAPFAIVCLAFKGTAGIFTAWLKSLIVICLTPAIWRMCVSLSTFLNDGTTAGMSVYLVMLPAQAALYMGAPALTAWIINKASGAAAMAVPSPVEKAASMIGSVMGARRGGLGGGSSGGSMVTEMFRNADGNMVKISTPIPPTPGVHLVSRILGGSAGKALSPQMQESILTRQHAYTVATTPLKK